MFAFYFVNRTIAKPRQKDSLTLEMCLACTAIFFSHELFFAPRFFVEAIRMMNDNFRSMLEIPIYRESARVVVTSYEYWTNMSTYILIFLTIAITSFAMFLIFRRKTMSKSQFSFWTSFLIAMVLPSLLMQYGAEAPYRAFTFGSVAFVLFSIYLLRANPRILFGVLFVVLAMSIPALYGSESFRLATSSELAGNKYCATYLPDNTLMLYITDSYVKYYNLSAKIRFTDFGGTPFYSRLSSLQIENKISDCDCIVVSRNLENYYMYYLGINPFNETSSQVMEKLNKIYDNEGFSAFKHIK
jgi:ABC-type multidrug transport system permease subunit